jgi:hypothetical protein
MKAKQPKIKRKTLKQQIQPCKHKEFKLKDKQNKLKVIRLLGRKQLLVLGIQAMPHFWHFFRRD